MGLHFESRDLVGLEPSPCPQVQTRAAHPKQPGVLVDSFLGLPTPGPCGLFSLSVFMPPSEHVTGMLPPLYPAFLLEQRPRSQVPAVCPLRQPQLSAFQGYSLPSRPALPHPRLRLPPLIPSHSCGFLISLNLLSWNQTSSGSHGV